MILQQERLTGAQAHATRPGRQRTARPIVTEGRGDQVDR